MTRQEALELLYEYTQGESLRRHALAVEASMRAYAKKRGEDEEKWSVVGLLLAGGRPARPAVGAVRSPPTRAPRSGLGSRPLGGRGTWPATALRRRLRPHGPAPGLLAPPGSVPNAPTAAGDGRPGAPAVRCRGSVGAGPRVAAASAQAAFLRRGSWSLRWSRRRGVRGGSRCGRQERSSSPASPSASNRASHL